VEWKKCANWVDFLFYIALNGTTKCNKKKTKKNNKMQEQQEPSPDLDSAAAAEAEEQGEVKGRGMEELKDTDAAVSGMCARAFF
jgi:hypothetical protein